MSLSFVHIIITNSRRAVSQLMLVSREIYASLAFGSARVYAGMHKIVRVRERARNSADQGDS